MTRRLFVLVLIAGLVPAVAGATRGGPDSFGYTWTDEVDTRIDFTTIQTDLNLGPEEVSAPIDLGFTFPFYGQNYTRFVISSNGWLSFDSALANPSPTPQPLPAVANPNLTVAWFWRDLDAPLATGFSFHGPMPGGYKVRVVTQIPGGSPGGIVIAIGIYQTGVIKVSYDGLEAPETASVGIENETGTIGLNPSYLGNGENGFVLSAGKAIAYYPPPQLDCAGAGAITCGQTLTFSSPAAVSPNVQAYTCATSTYLGRERVIAFTNPGLADVNISLTRVPSNTDMDVFLLRQGLCSEYQCLGGSADIVDAPFLGTGTYYIVVDGKGATDNGSFDLRVECTPRSAVLNCQPSGSPPVRGTTSGASQYDSYPCSSKLFDGPEFIYEIPFTAPGNIKVQLTPDPNTLLDVLAFGPDTFDAPDGCIGWGDNGLTLFNPAGGRYFLMIDGYSDINDPTQANAGGFGINVTCDILLNCTAPAGDLQCLQTTSGTTVGATNRAELYSCSENVFSGPEVVYRFHNDRQRTVAFKWTGPPDLSLFLVQADCNEGSCLRHGNGRLVARDLPMGDYHVVVDGRNGASGNYTIRPICENLVDPNTGSWTLDPGQTIHELKALTVTGEPTYGDIMFSIDDTGSMGGVIANLQQTTEDIINQLAAQVDDVAFGLSTLEDYASPLPGTNCVSTGYGGGSDLPYRLNLPITSDLAALFATIQTLAAAGGGDGPESYLHSFFQMYNDAGNIRWRPGARQIVVMMGDNDLHACDTLACTTSRSPNGVELGPDFTPGTADDIEPIPLMNELKRRGIEPLFLQTNGNSQLLQAWSCWTGVGGGRAYDAPQGVLPAGLVQDIRSAIESRTLICYDLAVVPTPGFETWVTNVTPPSMQNVYLPAELNFDLDVGPPAGTPSGIYNFNIDFVCDGEVKATQVVTIEVPGACTPIGVIGNNLYSAKRFPDVHLEWRGMPLSIRSYNIHRETSRLSIDPPASAAIDSASADETYTDALAVSAPALYFYEVYGRDCVGNSIFN